jgi:C-terminal processing protease CtpA/Prc
MLFKSIICCSTFFAASFAGWNFSEQDSQQQKESNRVQQSQVEIAKATKNATSKTSNSNPSEVTTHQIDREARHKLQIDHQQWAKNHIRCSDCHTGAGETDEVDQFLKNFHGKTVEAEENESAFLGVITREIPAELRSHLDLNDSGHGVMIEKVLVESPAFHGGLEEHDILVSINDSDVVGTEGLSQIIRAEKPKSKISIRYIHHGKVESLSLVLGRHKTPELNAEFEIKGCHAKIAAGTNCRSCHKTK